MSQTHKPDLEKVPKHKPRTLKIALAVVLIILLALTTAVLWFVYEGRQMLHTVQYKDVDETIPIESEKELTELPSVKAEQKEVFKTKVVKDEKIRNILLIGTDRRDKNDHGRADAIILCTINESTKKIHLTSLMRAIYVSIPDDPDPHLKAYWRPQSMLNAAHTWGGPRLLLKTVQRNFRVDVQDYIEVDFEGFTAAVDALGGVPVNLTAAEAAQLNSTAGQAARFTAGPQVLNGKEALDYARLRKIDSDFVRTSRQRTVISEIFRKMKSAPLPELSKSVKAILPFVETNISPREILELTAKLPQYARYQTDQLLIPLETAEAKVYIGKMEMYDIDWKKNVDALHAFMKQ